nr:hypothetical protein [Tanacetum cinerariifolium]
MKTTAVDASEDFLTGLLTLFDFLVGSSGEAGTLESLEEAGFLNFHAFLGGVTPVAYPRDESQSVHQIVISGGMHANLVSLGDYLVFSKELVNDNFGESMVVHLVVLFVTSVVDMKLHLTHGCLCWQSLALGLADGTCSTTDDQDQGIKDQLRLKARIKAGGACIGAYNLLLAPTNSSLHSLT